jgi:Tol biopolymer transport system component
MRRTPDAVAPRDDRLDRREFLARAAAAGLCAAVTPLTLRADEPAPTTGRRISYFMNGEIHVNVRGRPEGTPLTTGHMDFKPSWSKTGDMLVCFRRTKDDPVTVKWKSAIFIINVDGTGFHQLTEGTRTDFNPTWTRDGRNTPIWNRKNDTTGGFFVMQGRVRGLPGQEVALTNEAFHTWAHSCLTDGRILVNSRHPTLGWGVYLMTCKDGARPLYEPVECELNSLGQLHRASISPSEKKICFEYLKGSVFTEPGHTLYIADFDAQQRTITSLKVIANQEGKPFWYAYPRWIEGEAAVVYHLNSTGKGELYVYRLEDGSTRRVSTNPAADYRYPHGEAEPC